VQPSPKPTAVIGAQRGFRGQQRRGRDAERVGSGCRQSVAFGRGDRLEGAPSQVVVFAA